MGIINAPTTTKDIIKTAKPSAERNKAVIKSALSIFCGSIVIP